MAVNNTYFDSRQNYQKIHLKDSYATSVGNPNSRVSTTITHGLGYVPNVRVWFENAAGEISTAVHSRFGSALTNYLRRTCYYEVNNQTLTITFDRGVTVGGTISTNIYYRIYFDAAES